jgi:uncharacterized membrane protein
MVRVADVTVTIAAAPSRLWEFLADVAAWPSWTASMTSVRRLDSGPLRVGSKAEVRQPKMPRLIWEVTVFEDAANFTWQARFLGVRTIARHILTEAEEGTRLQLTVDHEGLLAAWVTMTSGARTRDYVAMEAEGLKQIAEVS